MRKEGLAMGYAMTLMSAIIWGFAFVAQKSSMEVMGPFTFNAVRFLLGATVLLFLLPLFKSALVKFDQASWRAGLWMGVILFLGTTTQQIGIVTTSAAKAAFITGLYIVLVPILLAFVGQAIAKTTWLAVAMALAGLYLLSLKGAGIVPETGDIWVLASALFFALHIIVIGRYSRLYDPLRLSIVQFYVCAILSGIGMGLLEMPTISGIRAGGLEILYAGVLSTGVAYTLQVFAQKRVPTHTAALVLSLEAVFGAIGGIWLLGEQMTLRMLIGACLMMVAIFVAQFRPSMARARLTKKPS